MTWTNGWPALWVGLWTGIVALAFWFGLMPWLALRTWVEGDALCWRWGVLHHRPTERVALSAITACEVGTLPDTPTRPVRVQGSVTCHGGAFTPRLNRGVKLSLADGRTVWLALPEPRRFAEALAALRAPQPDTERDPT
jgi:hypothetical protein